MKRILTIFLALPLLAFSTQLHAKCSRSDIDYFLNKGFTQAQVVALCEDASTKAEPQQNYKSYSDEVQARIEAQEAFEDKKDRKNLLRYAVKAKDVRVTPDYLSYIHSVCASIGGGPDVSSRLEACPEIRYRIYFKGLTVKDVRRKYLIVGQREIDVQGRVKRKLLNELKDYRETTRKALLRVLRNRLRKGATYIPIRRDYPIQKVIEVLREYAAEAEAEAS